MVYPGRGPKKHDGSVHRDGCEIRVGPPRPEDVLPLLPTPTLQEVRKRLRGEKKAKKAGPKVVGKCDMFRMRKAMTEVCGGDIVEEVYEEFDPSFGPMMIGGSNPVVSHRELYCEKCGVMYHPSASRFEE